MITLSNCRWPDYEWLHLKVPLTISNDAPSLLLSITLALGTFLWNSICYQIIKLRKSLCITWDVEKLGDRIPYHFKWNWHTLIERGLKLHHCHVWGKKPQDIIIAHHYTMDLEISAGQYFCPCGNASRQDFCLRKMRFGQLDTSPTSIRQKMSSLIEKCHSSSIICHILG